jgi:hypothetical protein
MYSGKTADIKDGWRDHMSDNSNIDRRYKGVIVLLLY